MNLSIPRISGQPLDISVNDGERIFVVGANGSGKVCLDTASSFIVPERENQAYPRLTGNRGSNLEVLTLHQRTGASLT